LLPLGHEGGEGSSKTAEFIDIATAQKHCGGEDAEFLFVAGAAYIFATASEDN